MSRIIFYKCGKIVKEIVFRKDECRYKRNNICYNNKSKNLGKVCHNCKDYVKEGK